MRRLTLATVAIFSAATAAYAEPVFKPITQQPGMLLNKPAVVQPVPPQPAPATATTTTIAPTPFTPPAAATPAVMPVSRTGEIINSEGGGAIPSLPLEVYQKNGITYISGGIGEEELDQLKAQEALYNLRVLLTGDNGEFITDITMNLKDDKDNLLLSVPDAGPHVYMQVPVGNYVVEAVTPMNDGKKFKVRIPSKGAIKTQLRL